MQNKPKQFIFKYKFVFFFFLLLSVWRINAQNFIIHKVEKGQSLRDIAKIYQVAPSDIIKYNSELNSGNKLMPGQSILIPKEELLIISTDSIKLAKNPIDYKYHTVGDNETLFSLSKRYNSRIEEIVLLNNVKNHDIKLGQILIIPIYPDENAPKQIDTTKYTYYVVQPKQGKWRVAYNHGITIDELERLNPEIVNVTPRVGQKLIVPKFIASKDLERDEKNYIYHQVQPKETLYSLSKQYNVSIEDIKMVNPEIMTKGLKFGSTIKIPRHNQNNEETTTNKITDFDKKIKELKEKKQVPDTLITTINRTNNKLRAINLLDSMRLDKNYRVAILLPFKLKEIEQKTENVCNELTGNKILNYYSGIKMAIDSLKQLGLNVHYDVFDTQGLAYVSGKILKVNDLSKYDFVIGPVKKDNIEKVAHFLEFYNTPVAVHNYKGNKKFRNLVVTTSKNNNLENHIIQYLKETGAGKSLYIIHDPKHKTKANKIAVQLGLPVTKIAGKKTKKGLSIQAENITKAIKNNKESYVILLSDDDSFIFTVLSTLNALNNKHNITLFTLDDKKLYENDTNDRMNMFLSNLNYHFPAKMIRYIKPGFAKVYKAKYNTLPDFTAINGFDTTFDLLLRTANADNLFEGLQKIGRTVQTSKVYLYRHTPDTGFNNQASLILQVGEDLGLYKVE